MKKSLSVIICIFLVTSMFAQVGDLKKQTYLRFGISVPTWKYYGSEGKEDWPDESSRIGAVLESGTIFMLNSIKLSPGMRLGINVDYLSVNYHRFYAEGVNTVSDNLFFIGSKIGPSFSYSPVDRLTFDAFFKFNPVWVAGDIVSYQSDLVEDEFYLGFLGLKYGAGINVRYSILMLGFEINPGFVKMKLFDEEDSRFIDVYKGNNFDNGNKSSVPALNFTVGLSF